MCTRLLWSGTSWAQPGQAWTSSRRWVGQAKTTGSGLPGRTAPGPAHPVRLPGPPGPTVRWQARRGGPGGRAVGAVPGLVEQLAGRELEVPRMLATGMPNQAIAEELFVTLFTVKSTSATS